MAIYEELPVNELTLTGGIKDSSANWLYKTGSAVPSAVAGYAIGCIFVDTTTGKTYQNEGTASSCTFNSIGDIGAADIGANVVTPIKMGTRTLVALADSAATPTIAQLMTSSVFTMTPTAARNFTTPTAALMVAGVTGATVGSWFDFTIVNLGNFAITVVAGDAGVTLSGNAVVNKGSATFRAVLTNVTASSEALTIHRATGAIVTENIALANGSVLIGDANGLASASTPDTAGLVTKANAQTIAGVKTFSAPIVYDANTTITAFSGGGQGSAVALTGEFNNVTTVAADYDSVKLLAAVLGQTQIVKNSGASILSVFPNTDDAINALAANLSVDIPIGGELTFRAIDATTYETAEVLTSQAPTTQRGSLSLKAADNAANHAVTITNASHGQATVHTHPDGGAATDYVVHSTAALTLVEADVLDGATAGTQVASKAVVADANVNIGVVKATELHIGATGSETQVTATGAELNLIGGSTVGVPVASKALIAPASLGNGAVAGTGATVSEQGNGVLHKTVITFTNVDVPLTDAAGVVAYGGLKIYDMPEGAILMLGAVADVDVTKSSAGVNADWDGDMGVGVITASNDGTLAATEQNIIPTTATPQAVAGVTTANGQSTASENIVHDGTSTPIDVYFNLLVDDADHDVTGTPCNLILNGTLTLTWINLGDY